MSRLAASLALLALLGGSFLVTALVTKRDREGASGCLLWALLFFGGVVAVGWLTD